MGPATGWWCSYTVAVLCARAESQGTTRLRERERKPQKKQLLAGLWDGANILLGKHLLSANCKLPVRKLNPQPKTQRVFRRRTIKYENKTLILVLSFGPPSSVCRKYSRKFKHRLLGSCLPDRLGPGTAFP